MTEQANIESIFLKSLEIDDSQRRAAYLDAACASNPSLREEIERLLGSHEVAGGFLEGDAPQLQATELQCFASRNESVLQAMKNFIGPVTAVSLKDDVQPEPAQRVSSVEIPVTQGDGRYQLQGEIARGGMGAVLKGRDTDLGRDLAVKVLLDSHRAKPEVVQRFVEEAQIGGQLQHPGIAPVYELGQFEDQRPYFTMKLVKGKTLGALLGERTSLQEDRSKLLGIFEQVCQTVAYAHSRGVIHRDLKPANIMVGAFGEVQVMDWGLAKVLKAGGVADETRAKNQPTNQSIIETLRSSGSDTPIGAGSQTQMGSVMGTPAYMPPEQARGQSKAKPGDVGNSEHHCTRVRGGRDRVFPGISGHWISLGKPEPSRNDDRNTGPGVFVFDQHGAAGRLAVADRGAGNFGRFSGWGAVGPCPIGLAPAMARVSVATGLTERRKCGFTSCFLCLC